MPIRIEFAGGGTGGHLFPALALAEEFRRKFPDCEIIFWGTRAGIEFRLRDQLPGALRTIPVTGVRRAFVPSNLLVPFKLAASFMILIFHFLFKRPNLVIGTGGYVSGPVVFVASLLRIFTAIHEQNSYPGVTTRLLSRWAKRVYLTYESSAKYMKRPERIKITGNPIRPLGQIPDRETAAKKFGLSAKKNTVLAFGGSQGGRGINLLLEQIVQNLIEQDVQVIWATGESHIQAIRQKIPELKGLYLTPFIHDIYTAYAACDLVICRSGATTLAELTSLGIPAILIPFPFATGGHQEFNARELEKAKAAICHLEDEITGDELFAEIMDLLNNKGRLDKMAKAMKSLGKIHAANDIVSDLCDHLHWI